MLTPPNPDTDSSNQTTTNGTNRAIELPNLSFLFTDPTAKRLNVGSDSSTPSHTPLTTNTTFILSQLPALKALLEQLRPKLASLPKAGEGTAVFDTKRAERNAYIDGRTRLHLERNGELGGAAGEGHGVVKGRRVEREEVKALESVVEMFE